jgi:PTS system mannose-specific IIB component
MITFIRVDNRLVHGQVVEGWLPHLKVRRVVVLDREAAKNPLVRASMGLAVPQNVAFQIASDDVEIAPLALDGVPTMLLFRDIEGVFAAHGHGFKFDKLNLGNIHFKDGRRTINASIFLSDVELKELEELAAAGVSVAAQALPSDRPLNLAEIEARFKAGTGAGTHA